MPVSRDRLVELLSVVHRRCRGPITDTSDGCGQSFEVVIVSTAFEGKSLLQRHRLVNDAAKAEIAQIHAFSQKTYTPEQWAAQQAASQ
ncbi:hypothetical protein HK105_201235 [Polyrhizophydium stewartii]|uniref:BolA-like protein n=1 Tax=Polyrhizophydium stewartii TaxID=2732419 RepID=A0ABR4NHG0_9FUNG